MKIDYSFKVLLLCSILTACGKGSFYEKRFYFPPDRSNGPYELEIKVRMEAWNKGGFSSISEKNYYISLYNSHGVLLFKQEGKAAIDSPQVDVDWSVKSSPHVFISDAGGNVIVDEKIGINDP